MQSAFPFSHPKNVSSYQISFSNLFDPLESKVSHINAKHLLNPHISECRMYRYWLYVFWRNSVVDTRDPDYSPIARLQPRAMYSCKYIMFVLLKGQIGLVVSPVEIDA